MRKELFKLLVAEFEKLGVDPTKWLGTRTNVKRLTKNTMASSPINEFALKTEFEEKGVERILKLFDEEARYLAQLNDVEANQLLNNLKTANKIVNPPPLQEAGIYTLKEGKKVTADEFAAKKAADRAKIDSAILKAGMESSEADRELAKRLNLDMAKVGDYDKLVAWKKEHGVPDFSGERGIGSLFKTRTENELADLGTQIDAIEAEGKSLADEAKRLTDMAWKMSPEGQASEELFRKDILKRSMEGKGFAGGVFGDRSDGFFRAIVRPFLLDQHAKGKIKLADNTLKSLKNADDLKGGGDFWSADPVRVFRQHYGDDAFDLIPNQEAFGGGQYGPTSQEKIDVLEKVIGKPILKNGPETPGGYLTKGEYQAKLDHEDEVLRYINEGEGRFGEMPAKELAEEIASTKARKDSIMVAFRTDHPTANFQKKDFRTRKEWEDAEVKAQADETLTKNLEGTGVTKEGFVDPFKPTGATTPMTPRKLSLNIRLMKNFGEPLDDIGLAKEGYNVQEIKVLKSARNRMTTGEEMHPNEALLREKELLVDEAGIDLEDFDELALDIDWGDMTPEPMAQGGGVGSLFRERRPMFGGGLPLKWGKGIINYFKKKAADKKFMADLDKKLFDEKGNLKEGAVEKHFQDMTDSFQKQIDQRKKFIEATPPKDRKPNTQGGGVGSLFRERRPMFTGGLLTPWIKKTLVEVLKELGKDVSQFTPKQIDAAKMIGLGDPRIMRKNDLVTAILAKLDLSKSEVVMSDLKKRKEDIVEHFIEQQFSMREPLSTRPHYQSPDPALGEIEESKALLESYREKLAGRKPNAQGGGVGSMFRRV